MFLLTVLVFLSAASAWAQEADWKQEWNKTFSEARKEGKVVVAGFPDAGVRREIPAQFTARFGIPVEYLAANSSDAVARLRSERNAGLYTTDVLLSGIQALTHVAYPEKMLTPLKPLLILPEVLDASKWKRGRLWFMDPEERYILRLINYVSDLFDINTQHVKPDDLRSSKDLLAPKWKGKIAFFDPTVPGSGSNTAAQLYLHLGEEFVKRLYVDQQPMISRDRRQLADWLARGTYPISFGAAGSQIEKMQQEGFPISSISSFQDMSGVVSASFGLVVVLDKAPHSHAARLFVNWLASKDGLEVFSRAMGNPTVRNDVDESFLPQKKIPRPGVNYLDSYGWEFTVHQEEKIRNRMKEILRK
jgi:iron(III) transport system substrate-binding protein